MNSTHNIMALIEALLADGSEIGVRELGARTGIPKSTVQRFLSAMEDNGWVVQDKRTQGYRIGYKLLGQSNGWSLRLALINQSQDLLKDLCRSTGQGVALSSLDGFNAQLLSFSVPEGFADFLAQHPRLFDLHASASAKALLAFAPAPLRQYITYSGLKSCASRTITTAKQLEAEIETIREQGYATSVSELIEGAAEVAVPLLNPDQSVIAVVSVGGEKEKVEPRFSKFRAQLTEAAAQLMERLKNM